jgi:hypothetical protein
MLTITLPHPREQWEFKEFKLEQSKTDMPFVLYKNHELYNDVCVEEIFCVEATGEELLYILMHFKNLPLGPSYGKVVSMTWYGDDAKFIVQNI